ncbi:MAG: methylmalonyl-CoA epimerase [Bdellovibrionales bacterium]|nr:methylmalonyl-CoA epimerase [Bdellovibrionales bacterium]
MSGIDHIGIAVTSLEESLVFYTKTMGMTLVAIEEVPSEKVRVAILDCEGVRIELLEPTEKDSVIAKFIEKKGPGVHHMAYSVSDVEKQVGVLKSTQVKLIEPAPRSGAGGCTVAFVHPKSTGGVLVELVERPE